jgi:hypothetical protein
MVRLADCLIGIVLQIYRKAAAKYGVTACFPFPLPGGRLGWGSYAHGRYCGLRHHPLPDLPPKKGKEPGSAIPSLGVFSL